MAIVPKSFGKGWPLMILIATIAAALATPHLKPPSTVLSPPVIESARFSAAPPDAGTASLMLAMAQAKRVAAARGMPVATVRQLMLRYIVSGPDGKPMVDVVSLNQALDTLPSR